jgi:hypothetical protein
MRSYVLALFSVYVLGACVAAPDPRQVAAQGWLDKYSIECVGAAVDERLVYRAPAGIRYGWQMTLVRLGLATKSQTPAGATFSATTLGSSELASDDRDCNLDIGYVADARVTGAEPLSAVGPNTYRVEFVGTMRPAQWLTSDGIAALNDAPQGRVPFFAWRNKPLLQRAIWKPVLSGPISFSLVMHDDPADGWQVKGFTD